MRLVRRCRPPNNLQRATAEAPGSAIEGARNGGGSASWVLDVDIGAGVVQQTDPTHVDTW
jgi:hypothetical protein